MPPNDHPDWASQVALVVQEMQKMRVPSLGGEDPLIGNGNLLQYSCLENFMDGGSLVGYSLYACKDLDTTE